MNNLNKYWFVITLTAVIFFLLGFLIGKTQNPPYRMIDMPNGGPLHKIIKSKNTDGFNMIWTEKEGSIIMIDTLATDEGPMEVIAKKKIQ